MNLKDRCGIGEKNRQTDQLDRRESPEVHCKHMIQLSLTKKQRQCVEQNSLFNASVKHGHPHAQKITQH